MAKQRGPRSSIPQTTNPPTQFDVARHDWMLGATLEAHRESIHKARDARAAAQSQANALGHKQVSDWLQTRVPQMHLADAARARQSYGMLKAQGPVSSGSAGLRSRDYWDEQMGR